MPFAFTEHSALTAAFILNTPRAVEVSLYVVRAFVELHEALAAHDRAIAGILEAIRQLMTPPEPTKKRRIGFVQTQPG